MVDKEYLRRHAEHRKELQDELQRYELDHGCRYYGKSPSNIDGMPHASSGGSSVFDKIEKDMDTVTYIDKLETLVNVERIEIEKVIRLLRSAEQKSVIRYKYFSCLDWEDVSFYMYGNKRDYCKRSDYYKQKAQKVHGNALKNIIRMQRESDQ